MTWALFIAVLVLGLVQGLTEFLPVSSSGHLILADRAIGFEGIVGGKSRVVLFEVVIQIGAILAILVEYGRELAGTMKSAWRQRAAGWRAGLWPALVIGTVPVVLVGGLFGGTIQDWLFTPHVVAWSFIVGGVVMWIVESLPLRPRCTATSTITAGQALLIGCAQVLALVPGTSRSAATILGGMGAGLDRRTATEFSFLMALPVLSAATIYTLARHAAELDTQMLLMLAVGLLVSFVSAWLAMRWLLRYVRHHTLKGFALYRIAFGAVLLTALAV